MNAGSDTLYAGDGHGFDKGMAGVIDFSGYKEVPASSNSGDAANTYTGDVDMDEFTLPPHEKQALGYIKLWRCSRSSSVWACSLIVWRVFTWLLMSVNYKPRDTFIEGKHVHISEGEIITSYAKLSDRVSPHGDGSVTPKMVRTAIDVLCRLEVITKIGQASGHRYLHLKVLHWDQYQSTDWADQQAAEGQAEGRPRAGTKEPIGNSRLGKNVKEGKEEVVVHDYLLDFALNEIPDSESTAADYRAVIDRHKARLDDATIERVMSDLANWTPPKPRKKWHLTLNKWLLKEEPQPAPPESPYPTITDVPETW